MPLSTTLGGMRIVKRGHACLEVHDAGQTLVIDPGDHTEPLEIEHLAGVVITHEHADHWDDAHLGALRRQFPEAPFFGPPGVLEAAEEHEIVPVHAGETHTVGPFELRFFGGEHAVIHDSIPVVDNVGVLVNGALYYPGDSFAVPDVAVDVLATPAGAPWLKISEVMDFVVDVAPKRTFATHVLSLSEDGLRLSNARIRGAVEHVGGEHIIAEPGTAIET